MTLTTQAIASARWTGLSSLITTLTTTAQNCILAFLLSPADFGVMSFALLLIGFVQLFLDFGVSAAIISKQDASETELSTYYWMNVGTGVILFATTAIVNTLCSSLFSPNIHNVIFVTSITFLIAPWSTQLKYRFQRDLNFAPVAIAESCSATTSLLTSTSMAWFGYGFWSLSFAFLAHSIVLSSILLAFGYNRFRPKLLFCVTTAKSILPFGTYQIGEKAFAYIGERADQFIIGSVIGTEALGYYWFALNLTSLPLSRINPIVNSVTFPLFARLKHDKERLTRGFLSVLRILIAVNSPILGGIAVTAPLFVPLIFGDKWNPSIYTLQILCVVAMSRSIGNPVGTLLLSFGKARVAFGWTILFLLMNVPSIYIGGLVYGINGVAISLAIVQCVLQFLAYYLLIRPILGRIGNKYSSTIFWAIAPAIVMHLTLALALKVTTPNPSLFVLIVTILSGVAFYFLLTLLLQPTTVQNMKAFVPSFTHRKFIR